MGEGGSGAWPTGTVTFLVTDIEASTRLYQSLGSSYEALLDEHRSVARSVFEPAGGVEVSCPGDGFLIAFASPSAAVEVAVEIQRRMTAHPWPENAVLRVRAGAHTGEAALTSTGGTYVGLSLHEAARVGDAGHGGQVLLSESTYRLVEHQLPPGIRARSLGAHELAGLDGVRSLYELEGPGLPSGFPALRTDARALGNLPPSTNELVGRADDVADLVAAVPAGSVTTVLGPGGIGKTRLAVEVGHALERDFDDGVWFVDLAAIAAPSSPAELAAGIGRSLELNVAGPLALGDVLRGRATFLVLDNGEHVVDALAEVVEEVARAAPSVRMLATSRERLGVAGERVHALDPLPEPFSVELFRARAREVVPELDLTEDESGVVAQICGRLDGLPLAIELAAKRINVLTPAEILDRLDDRFALLTGGGRGVPDRHRTLEATLDWSFSLLTEAQQMVLRRLSVFAGGCTLPAAQVVCSGGAVAEGDVLDHIAALADRSLVRVERAEQRARYRLLETVRAYAASRLEASGELAAVRNRHLRWCASVSWAAVEVLIAGGGPVDFEQLSQEGDNLRAAVDWARAGGDLDDGLRTAAGMGLHGFETGKDFRASVAWMAELLAAGAGATDPELRGWALFSAGNVAMAVGDTDTVRRHGEEILSLVDRFELSDALRGAALVTLGGSVVDDLARASALIWEGADLQVSAGAAGLAAFACSILCLRAVDAGEIETAALAADRGLEIARRAGSSVAIARALSSLANVAIEQGDPHEALARSVEAVAVARAAGAQTEHALALIAQARAVGELGDGPAAGELYLEATRRFAQLGFASPRRRIWAGISESRLRVGDETIAAIAVGLLVEAMDDPPFDPATDPAAHQAIYQLLQVAAEHGRDDLVQQVRDRIPPTPSG